jgi:ABC-2 type transport system ATP-binding protein
VNGLDPEGIRWIREFMRSLAREGRAVLLSSHLMSEIEQTSDRVGVIRDGVLVAEGTVEQLRGQARLRVRADPLDEAARIMVGAASEHAGALERIVFAVHGEEAERAFREEL